MTKWNFRLSIVLLIAGIFCLVMGCRDSKLNPFSAKKHVDYSQNANPGSSATSPNETLDDHYPGRDENGRQESKPTHTETPVESLHTMVSYFKKYTEPGHGHEELLEDLIQSNQAPEPSVLSNPYTGDLFEITTRSPLPGTRYFYAQFRGSENSEEFMQMMHFEFRPGPKALDEAKSAVRDLFGEIGEPTKEDQSLVWQLNNGYEILLQEIDANDVSSNNQEHVYTKEDVGTVRVTIQIPGPDDN